MFVQEYEKALINLYKLMEQGSGEHAHLLMPTDPIDSSLPEDHCWISNFKDDGISDQISCSKDVLHQLEVAKCFDHPYAAQGKRNPFTLSHRGIAYAKRLIKLFASLNGKEL